MPHRRSSHTASFTLGVLALLAGACAELDEPVDDLADDEPCHQEWFYPWGAVEIESRYIPSRIESATVVDARETKLVSDQGQTCRETVHRLDMADLYLAPHTDEPGRIPGHLLNAIPIEIWLPADSKAQLELAAGTNRVICRGADGRQLSFGTSVRLSIPDQALVLDARGKKRRVPLSACENSEPWRTTPGGRPPGAHLRIGAAFDGHNVFDDHTQDQSIEDLSTRVEITQIPEL